MQTLISEQQLQQRVAALAREISNDHPQGVHLVCVLKGAFMFLADLVRTMTCEVTLDFMAVSSYGMSTRSSGEVRLLKDLDYGLEGRSVVIVEDIVDTGLTLQEVLGRLAARQPASLAVCTLLDKPARRRVPVEIRYIGFAVPDEFVVGYCLDYGERYRNLPFIGVLKPEIYSAG
jgi:hypoxanthine phosphoribosyltransferase